MDSLKAGFVDRKMTGSIVDVEKGQLIPYIMSPTDPNTPTPLLFNGVQLMRKPNDKPVTAETFKITGLPRGIERRKPGAMVTDSIEPYRKARIDYGTQAFWDDLMRKGDRYSVRQYLTVVENYDYNTIEFLETMNFGSRWVSTEHTISH